MSVYKCKNTEKISPSKLPNTLHKLSNFFGNLVPSTEQTISSKYPDHFAL